MRKYLLVFSLLFSFIVASNKAQAEDLTVSVTLIPNTPFWVCVISNSGTKVYSGVFLAFSEDVAKLKCKQAFLEEVRGAKAGPQPSGGSSKSKSGYTHTTTGHHGNYGLPPAIIHYHTLGCEACEHCECGHGQ